MVKRLLPALVITCLVLTLIGPIYTVVYGQPAQKTTSKPEPIVLKAVTFLPGSQKYAILSVNLLQKINERANATFPGELTIKYLGGPEVVPSANQPVAVQDGLVDIAWVPWSFGGGITPLGQLSALSELTNEEERRPGGAHDFLVEHAKKFGLYNLGRQNTELNLVHLNINKNVKTPQELAKLKCATIGAVWEFVARGVGMEPVTMPPSDYYTAIERGVVSGFINATYQTADQKLYEVTPYFIDHPFLASNVTWMMNLKSWNRLPKHLQDLIVKTMVEMSPLLTDQFKEFRVEGRQKMLDGRMKPITFSPQDAESFLRSIRQNVTEGLLKITERPGFRKDGERYLKLIMK